MNYKKPLFQKSKKNIIITFVVIALMLAAGALCTNIGLPDRFSGIFFGFATGLALVVLIVLLRSKRDPQSERQLTINANDERCEKIREKSAYTSWYISIFSLSAGVLLCAMLDMMPAAYILLCIEAIHAVSYFALLNYNGKRL
jgi:uncharacterized membrane protein